MAPKSSTGNTYKDGVKLDLDLLKKSQTQTHILTNSNIKTLSTLIGILSGYVKLYMELLKANRYHALNDRTILFFITRCNRHVGYNCRVRFYSSIKYNQRFISYIFT